MIWNSMAAGWNVLADEFRRWFDGLWQGKSLAFTITFITIFISFGFFLVAYHLPPDLNSVQRSENDQNRTNWKKYIAPYRNCAVGWKCLEVIATSSTKLH
jgi:hypothetical protein